MPLLNQYPVVIYMISNALPPSFFGIVLYWLTTYNTPSYNALNMVNNAVPADKLMEKAFDIAQQIASHVPLKIIAEKGGFYG